MRYIINENIIKSALHESIDEFILEEGALDYLKQSKLGRLAGSAWNGLRNFAANYMDKQTNGAWNKKYNIYADNTANSIRSKNVWDYWGDMWQETKYLTTWFNTHVANLEKILHYKEGPSYSLYGKNNFFNSSVWMGISGATQYIQAYCTYQNFLDYAKQYFTDYQGNEYIEQYIDKYITPLANMPQKCLSVMNMRAFNGSSEGKAFYQQSREDRNSYIDKMQKNNGVNDLRHNLQQEASYINTFFGNLQDFFKKYNDNIEYFMDYSFDEYFMNYFNNYLNSGNKNTVQRINLVKEYVKKIWEVWKQTIKNKPNKLKQFINQISYNVFLKNEQGKRYWFLQRQMGVYGNK